YTNFEFHGRCSFIVVLSLNKTLKESALFFNPSYISHNKCYTTETRLSFFAAEFFVHGTDFATRNPSYAKE
ncbi:MAG: hypothetical protein PHR43_04270, partial [Dehalococcoidales bacterium]|nr:hypothetical protein [Dehalococcoidales bacterium]